MDFKKILEKFNALSSKQPLNENIDDNTPVLLEESLVKLLKEADIWSHGGYDTSMKRGAVEPDKFGGLPGGAKVLPKDEHPMMTRQQAIEKVKAMKQSYAENPNNKMLKAAIDALVAKFKIPESLDEGWDDMLKSVKDREKEKGTGKFDKKKTSTGTVYSRKAEKDADDEEGAADEKPAKRGRGRPKKVSEMTDVEFFQALAEDIDDILAEKKMTKSAEEKREKIVKGMKKDKEGLKDRYGSRWKEVMYATATKKALGESAKPVIKESTERDFRREFNHSELETLKKVASGETHWDDMSEGLQERVYDFYLHEMPYGVAKARTGDPYQWCERRLRQDLGVHEQAVLNQAPTGENSLSMTNNASTIPSIKQTLNAALGEEGFDHESTAFESDPLDDLRDLPQPITLNGGDFYYTADVSADPLIWTADDGSTVKITDIREISEYLDDFNNQMWTAFLDGTKSVDDLISDGVLILNSTAESVYYSNKGTVMNESSSDNRSSRKTQSQKQISESVNELLKLAGLRKDGKPKQQLNECGMVGDTSTNLTPTQSKGYVNISTSFDADSNSKSVSISASGEQADDLMQLLSNAGLTSLSGVTPAQAVVVADPAVSLDGHVEEEFANKPNPKVGSIESQLDSGNDMHRKKASYSNVAGGDNPMSHREDSPRFTMESIKDRLWRQYESLKKQVAEGENKKPDEDGDGVPDWADKKPGKDDNADKKDKKKSEHEKQTLMDRSCGK